MQILTVGHSNHPLEHFLALLAEHGVAVLADVRSQPASRFAPHFNRKALAAALGEHGIQYVFFGAELGGRPAAAELYDDEGHVLYGRIVETDAFRNGIDRVAGLARDAKVAVMCSEEDPAGCHRRLLVGRVLAGNGFDIEHIRGDGRIEAEPPALLEPDTDDWRSVRPVRKG